MTTDVQTWEAMTTLMFNNFTCDEIDSKKVCRNHLVLLCEPWTSRVVIEAEIRYSAFLHTADVCLWQLDDVADLTLVTS